MKERISYQGSKGAYSHLACKSFFKDAKFIACDSFSLAMKKVEEGKCSYAMIPVENSIAGRVEQIYRLIPKLSLHIVAEHYQEVKHCLLAIRGAKLEDIKEVSSHPQALAQCRRKIESLNIKAIASFDTAGAAKDLNKKTKAAIASSLAAKLYGLDILVDNFADYENNFTKFIILSKDKFIPKYKQSNFYITSIFFTLRNIPSSLYKALGGFASNGINLLKLESYSVEGSFELSQFHIDIDGHIKDNALKRALDELNYFAKEVKILGVYRRNELRKFK